VKERLRIAIVGYGTAGQAAALFLAAQGHTLSVYEQAPMPGPAGAGFLLQPTGLAVLTRLGLGEQVLAWGQRIDRLSGCNQRGRLVMDMRYADYAPDCFGLGLSRGSLFTVLRDAYADHPRVHTGKRMVALNAAGDGLLDSDSGEHGPFDLIVAADGAQSALRHAIPGVVRRERTYPWGAMWCLLPADDWPHATVLHQRYGGTREMIGLLPVGRCVDRDGHWLTFYFSLPRDQVHAFDASSLQRMRQCVAILWPELLPLLASIETPDQMQRARYLDVVVRQSTGSRVAFIGDAAHAMSPQLGQGVNMALLDAEALADALAGSRSIAEALHEYARRRETHLRVYQALSRWLTPLFQSDRHGLAGIRDVVFGPLGRMPLARGQMLKILTGTKTAWW
jgi:2-polyprenyl-6-methoxyphenol hydroxylase-like FAD-dependent oxidoreductase